MMYKALIIFIFLLGLFLRYHNYTQYPPRGASSDEYTYTFLGQSLWQTGIPTSWSHFPQYAGLGERNDITIDKILFPIVTPYFDHPPLNGLLVGAWALLNGENTFQKVTIGTIRQVPIMLWLISATLLYFLGRSFYDKKTVAWGLLIYSLGTLYVMETRTVFAENLLTPLFLGSTLIFVKFHKSINLKITVILAILTGLSFWTKELGVAVLFSILSFMILEKIKKKYIIVFTVLSIVLISLYGVYGYYYNWPLFLAIISVQGLRELGPNTLNTLVFHPIVVNKLYFDGWYFLGFFSFFAGFVDFKKHQYFLIPSLIYFLLMLFSLTQHGEMGWYMIPLFPLFSILSASILSESIKKGGLYIVVFGLFIGMFITRYYVESKFGLSPLIFRGILVAIFGPIVGFYLLRKALLVRLFSNGLFYAFMAATFYITYYYIHPL